MSKPTASVVIPCYNVVATIAETIASVSAQTMPDFEIIAVDNNCTDGTVELLKTIALDEPRLCIVQEAKQGLSAARNCGIRAARADVVAFVDGDDVWDKDYLSSHLENIAQCNVDISYSRVRMIDPDSHPTGAVTKPQLTGLKPADLLRSNPCTALIVVKASVLETAGLFDENLRSLEDQEWLFRALAHGAQPGGIDRVLAGYRISPGGLSADLDTMLKSHALLLDAAAIVEPLIVERERTRSRAAMLRYCARRAIEHGKGATVAWSYFKQMLWMSPWVALYEPLTTVKVAVRIALAGLSKGGSGSAATTAHVGSA